MRHLEPLSQLDQLGQLDGGAAFDVVVIGAGAAGLSAALFAAINGHRVLVVEHTAWVGGTSAWSAGTTWVPGTPEGAQVNPADTLAAAATYLDHAVGQRSPAALRQAFLDHGARAVAHIQAHTAVHYRAYPKHPDYLSDLPGASLSGRALEPLPFDGRLLGEGLAWLRPPIPEFTVLGGMMVDRTDINHLLGMGRSWASFQHALKIVTRHALDRLRFRRGTRLVMGNALVGRLLYSLMQRSNVTLALNTSLLAIERSGANAGTGTGCVTAVSLRQGGQDRTVRVNGGLILASGGFNRHPSRRAQWLPGIDAAWCPAAPGHSGAAHDVALALGAQYGPTTGSPAFWAPVSLRRRADGSQAVFPHFVMDRAKPGMMTVNQAGERFVNESTPYHLFGLAMQHTQHSSPATPAYLVCDALALKKYGLGMVRPGCKGLAPFLADGYLSAGATLAELAGKLGINPSALQASVARFNGFARSGLDPDFARGSTAYQRNLGDPTAAGPNPNLGALTQAPFYALRLYPGDIGASTGLATNAAAQVLDAQARPIPGLYAVGNDMHSIMGGAYPAPGITLGPGLVFAYLATQDIATRLPTPN